MSSLELLQIYPNVSAQLRTAQPSSARLSSAQLYSALPTYQLLAISLYLSAQDKNYQGVEGGQFSQSPGLPSVVRGFCALAHAPGAPGRLAPALAICFAPMRACGRIAQPPMSLCR